MQWFYISCHLKGRGWWWDRQSERISFCEQKKSSTVWLLWKERKITFRRHRISHFMRMNGGRNVDQNRSGAFTKPGRMFGHVVRHTPAKSGQIPGNHPDSVKFATGGCDLHVCNYQEVITRHLHVCECVSSLGALNSLCVYIRDLRTDLCAYLLS